MNSKGSYGANDIFLHSMEKKSTKVDFSPISCKKHHSTLEMDTFKVERKSIGIKIK